MRRFVGTVPEILGLVWPSFRPNSGLKSKISGRILKVFGAARRPSCLGPLCALDIHMAASAFKAKATAAEGGHPRRFGASTDTALAMLG